MDQESRKNIQWFYPVPVNKRAITISHADYLTLNQALMAEVTSPVIVGICREDRSIHLQKVASGGWSLPKNGVLRDRHIIKYLKEAGMEMPARFTVTETADGWLGTLDDQPGRLAARKKPQKITPADMQSLKKEAHSLCAKNMKNRKC